VDALGQGPWDLLIIGGGIVGAGAARDAAMRGLRVALVERGDIGAGTSSRSSRLVHGGLRYLEHGEFRLVFEALHERAILRTIAPHLVHPLPFVFPVHRGDRVPRWKLLAGLWLYDLLAGTRNVRAHRMLGKRELLRAEPMLRERGLIGGARYWDCQVDDARLTLGNARSAAAAGAAIATYTAVTSLERTGGRITGVHLVDQLTGTTGTATASVIVNATGPWADHLRAMEEPGIAPILRLTRGSHVLVPRERLGHTDAVTLTSAVDGRVMFVLPWGKWSYIGTTDTDHDGGPDEVRATREDVTYLLRSANAAFPQARLVDEDVIATWSAVRPLVQQTAALSTAAVSREHAILTGSAGMLTIVGGKLTTYRRMAAELVDRVSDALHRLDGRPRAPRAPTDRVPLPGGEAADLAPLRARAIEAELSEATADHLVARYGAELQGIVNLVASDRRLAEPLHPAHPAIAAEVVHVTRREIPRTVDDVLARRIRLQGETADHGVAAAAATARLMGEVLGWDKEGVAREAERYVSAVRAMAGGDRSASA
jgi:glycerol-3-phosphate dehydrogenase